MINVPAYLNRIGYSGEVAATRESLRGLHYAHLLAVPFENLDIARGRKIVCDSDSFIQKIVEERRGGFCYELNGAFAALLRGIGFEVTLLSARVTLEDGGAGPEFDHLALRVDLDEPWLADVGFGDSFLEPLRLNSREEQLQYGQKFRIVNEGGALHMERVQPDGSWKRQYTFTLTPHGLNEFAAMCHYHQTSPDSPFTRKSVCSLATPWGRVTLSDRRLIFTRNEIRDEKLLNSEKERQIWLRDYFNVRF